MRLNTRHDSFSSDDELPLKLIKNLDSNSYRKLQEPSIIHCEFCDRVFKNKYKSLIHNATHIIIPLINQKLIKCNECLYYFKSQTDYQKHCKKHIENDKSDKYIKIRNRIKFEEDILNNSTDILKDLNSQVNVKLENLQINELVKNNSEINNINDNNNLQINNYSKMNNNFDINNTIIDISDDDSPLIKNKFILGTKKNNVNSCTANGMNGFDKNTPEMKGNGVEYESVHFDDLNKPVTVRCHHCKQKYPNQYSLILHQTSHIDFDRRLPPFCAACDWYIAGDRNDLIRHKRSHPQNTRQKIFSIEKCLKCGLSYRSYINHFKNYHNNNDDKYNKITRVCDLCYQFLKSSKVRSYVKIGTISKVGKRFKCSRCMRKFFELNEVQKTEQIQKWCIKRTIRKMTNNQRLKKIQYRLKKINDLSKF